MKPIAAVLVAVLAGALALAQEPPVNWDLSQIYSTEEAWETARSDLVSKKGTMDRFKGRLGSDASTLKAALDEMFALRMQATRLAAYASMLSDEDTRESGPQGMRQSLQTVFAEMLASVSWVDPEILDIPSERLAAFLEEEPGLASYGRYLEQLEERRPHVLDPESERLLGMAQRIRGDGATIGNLLRNAEMPWPTITLSDGGDLRVDPSGYVKGRSSPNRDDRVKSYAAFYGQLQCFKGTLAATLSATVQEHVFESRVRKYDSSLEAALAANEVDPAVYHMLIKEINASLPTLQRYFRLRAQILGIDDLRYHDMYPPLVSEVTTDYSWENSKKLVADALEVLGQDYVARLGRALDSGWVDVYPRPGKRGGAYVNDAAYEVHPYMLLNHQDDYLSATTVAHEGGHLMHSWFSQEAQPYPTAEYVIFVAEVASTVNEVIFFKNLVSHASNDEERLALLGNFLEGLRGTVFRQTMFAEFELAIHEAAERGEPLTGDGLNALYVDMLRRYHGEAEGVMKIDDLYAAEWAFVPHFHYNFYVYQYATSYVAAIALAEGILQDRPGARERFLAFLKAGSTKQPVELLADAGVDMTSPEPIRAAMRLMNEVMDQIDEILARRTGRAAVGVGGFR
jgi:oligoendopeptidase F